MYIFYCISFTDISHLYEDKLKNVAVWVVDDKQQNDRIDSLPRRL